MQWIPKCSDVQNLRGVRFEHFLGHNARRARERLRVRHAPPQGPSICSNNEVIGMGTADAAVLAVVE